MRVRNRHAVMGLSVLALLPACQNGAPAPETSTTTTPMPTTVAAPPPAPPTPATRDETWVHLQVGECITTLPQVELGEATVTIVDCGTAHQAEVYLRAAIAVDNALDNVANRECAAGFPRYTGQSFDGGPFTMTYLIDSEQNRTSSNPMPSTVICLLQSADGRPLTESARRETQSTDASPG